MGSCRHCSKKFPLFSIWDPKRPNPLGAGHLCRECYQPYGLVLEKYTLNLKKADVDPKAAAWAALCCLLAARRINLIRTLTAALAGFTETQHSWIACRAKSIELAAGALARLPSDSEGCMFLKGLLSRAEEVTQPPPRSIPIQVYASVLGDSILDIELQAIMRSGASIDELNCLVASLPGHSWLESS